MRIKIRDQYVNKNHQFIYLLLTALTCSLKKESRSSTRKLKVIKFFTATESLTQPCLKIFIGAERKIEHLNI